jgi:hypothetical protein
MAARGTHGFRVAVGAAGLAALLVARAPLATPLFADQAAAAAPTAPPYSVDQQEEFLKKAKVLRTRSAGKGVTDTTRATLTDGTTTHDASIQTIDQSMREFRSNRGTELNFVDSWRYNVAAYRLDRLLGINMTPPSVERTYQNKVGSFTWWVDDVLMDEGARLKDKVSAPDVQSWNEQMYIVRLFDQLIYNVDRNVGNLLIDKQWRVWMIDHSRAFRLMDMPKAPGNLSKCDRRVVEKLRALDNATLTQTMKDYLTPQEITALLKRRDFIVRWFEARNGVFDWQRPARPAQ